METGEPQVQVIPSRVRIAAPIGLTTDSVDHKAHISQRRHFAVSLIGVGRLFYYLDTRLCSLMPDLRGRAELLFRETLAFGCPVTHAAVGP
jgi:hypothetical protein